MIGYIDATDSPAYARTGDNPDDEVLSDVRKYTGMVKANTSEDPILPIAGVAPVCECPVLDGPVDTDNDIPFDSREDGTRFVDSE